jgi:predicted nucleotidyltransferase
MDSLRQVAAALSIPERTLRRAANEGLIHGERVSPRRFRVTLREEGYLRCHWKLLYALRSALRTEPNVRLAVLFGSTAKGEDIPSSDLDVLVVLDDPALDRLVELTERLSRRLDRDVQLIRLEDAEAAPALMADVIEQGRVLVDRAAHWPGLSESGPKWRRQAERTGQLRPETMDDLDRRGEPV